MAYSNPPYRKNHQGEAYVRINGCKYMLGKHGSQASLHKYELLILEWEASGKSILFGRTIDDITVAEVMLGYNDYLSKEAERKGPKSEANRSRNMFNHLPKVYRSYRVRDFKLDQLRAVRLLMIKGGLARRTINGEISRLLRMFQWAIKENYFSTEECATLFQIKRLQEGEFGVKELPPIRCVSPQTVFKTIPHCSPVVADLVLLQMKTGCRSAELLNLRLADIDCSGEFWIADVKQHKNKHRGKDRMLVFDVSCQAILKKYLDREPTEFLFQPCESEQVRRAKKTRKTPLNSGNSPGNSKRVREGRATRRKPGPCYSSQSYGRAIRYACEQAFAVPEGASPSEAKRWRNEHRWTPHQLRHTAATIMRETYGAEATAVLLGHSKIDTTLIYAENTRRMSIDAAMKYSAIAPKDVKGDFSERAQL